MECYETRSINKAAKSLFISPQGLGKLLDRLEQELRIQLFERTKQGLIPTEAGVFFYEKSQKLIEDTQELEQGLEKVCGDCVRSIGITFTEPEQSGTLSTYVDAIDGGQSPEQAQTSYGEDGITVPIADTQRPEPEADTMELQVASEQTDDTREV